MPVRLAVAIALAAALGSAVIVDTLHDGAASDICTAPESVAAR
ncbi:MAG: hypothetical protein WCO67_19635 [Betaproteobacteria bacterium]